MTHYLKIFGEDFTAPRTSTPAEAETDTPAPPPITTEDVDAAYAKGVQDGQTTSLTNTARQTQDMVQALLPGPFFVGASCELVHDDHLATLQDVMLSQMETEAGIEGVF